VEIGPPAAVRSGKLKPPYPPLRWGTILHHGSTGRRKGVGASNTLLLLHTYSFPSLALRPLLLSTPVTLFYTLGGWNRAHLLLLLPLVGLDRLTARTLLELKLSILSDIHGRMRSDGYRFTANN